MADKKQTIFQRILNVIDPTPKNYIDPLFGEDNYEDEDLMNRLSDFDRASLEKEQMKLLTKQYSSIAKGRYDRNSLYGYNRQLVYLEFEQMEFYPAIARALDIFSEESCTSNSDGRILGIQAREKRVKEELERLFYQVMAINNNLFYWTREIVKFGEIFLSRNVIMGEGITNIEQVPGLDVQIEFKEDERGIKKKVFDLTGSQLATEMSPLTMGHIKLLGDGRYAPYGVSMIDKARKIYQQLRLAEDAMLVYRVTRAPERRVYKIDVGNLNPQEADEHVANIRKDMKQDSIVGRDGSVDLRAKYLRTDEDIFIPVRNGTQTTVVDTLPGACLTLDTKIYLLDGRLLELSNIIKEHEESKEMWTYSINPNTGEIIPSPITWAGVTRKNTDIVQITLDNGKIIKCTPDHKIPKKNGEVVEAQHLKEKDFLCPFKETEISVVSVIFLSQKEDTGTITVDGNELYSNYHNFPIEAGIFVNNSNLGDIHDIEYLRDNLFTALGIPKAYLGYEEPAGQGKNLAQEDIRLARTVNRIQQSVINGLNEMAIIHLMAMGYEDITVNDFKLTLTNPSTQGDILKLELINQQIDVYDKAVSTSESGIAPFSITSAKKRILGMSDAEIMQDLKQQRVEKAVSAEIQKTGEVINSTGIFNSIDSKFDSYDGDAPTGSTQDMNAGGAGVLPVPAVESLTASLEEYVKVISEDSYEEFEKLKRKSKVFNGTQIEKDKILKEEKIEKREKNITKNDSLLKKISKLID